MEGELGIGGGGIWDWWRGYLGMVEGVFGTCPRIWLKYHCIFLLRVVLQAIYYLYLKYPRETLYSICL